MKYYILIILLSLSAISQAQKVKALHTEDDITTDLTDEQKRELNELARGKISELQNTIATLGSTNSNRNQRTKAMAQVEYLFIPEASFQVSTNKNGNIIGKRTYKPVIGYFEALQNLREQSQSVTIEFYNMAKMTTIRQSPDGLYYSTASIYQYFRRVRRDGSTYIDKTIKQVTIVLKEVETRQGRSFAIQLGDVEAKKGAPVRD